MEGPEKEKTRRDEDHRLDTDGFLTLRKWCRRALDNLFYFFCFFSEQTSFYKNRIRISHREYTCNTNVVFNHRDMT